jgi:histone deacetylase complex regulatory component SIN3
MFTFVAAEYAFTRINGGISASEIDISFLKRLMEDYAGVEVYLQPYSPSTADSHYLLISMDYFTYGEESEESN